MSRPVIRKARIKDTDRIIKLLSELGIPGPKKEEEIKHFAHIYTKKFWSIAHLFSKASDCRIL